MSTNPTNPYAAPKAPLSDETVALPNTLIPGGRKVPAEHGWTWIADAWRLFMRAPGMWIAISLTSLVIFFVLALIPFLGGIALTLLMPVLGGGVMLGCRALDEGKDLEFQHLFAGFRSAAGSLIAIGAIYLAGTIVIMVIAMVLTGASLFAVVAGGAQNPAAIAAAFTTMALAALIALALAIPLVMAIWFAPPLVVLNGLGAVDAMKQSFTGCLKNIVPFLLYGVVLFVAAFIASLPLLLGWLVLGPVVAASIYTGYKDIYLS
jgi:uncharacterized membrane protein